VWVTVISIDTDVGAPPKPDTVNVTSRFGPAGGPHPTAPRSGIAPSVPAFAGNVVPPPASTPPFEIPALASTFCPVVPSINPATARTIPIAIHKNTRECPRFNFNVILFFPT
jgi:hypothetical protein